MRTLLSFMVIAAVGAERVGPEPLQGEGARRHARRIDAQDAAALKATILASGLSVSQLVATAWASASTALRKRGIEVRVAR